jgi:hypothetical protein
MSFKRGPPRLFSRISAGRTYGIATLLGLFTIEGVGVGLLPPGWIVGTLAMAIPPTVSAAVAYIAGRFEPLPATLIDELSQDGKYACRPCNKANLKLACDIVRPLFGHDHVDLEILEQWRLRNPQGFMQIENEQHELTACFVILGLRPSFFTQLIEGTVVEAQIEGETVLPMRESKRQSRIYISGVMVRDPKSYIGAKRARVMIYCILKYLRHHYGFDKEFFAVALNRQSDQLLKSLNFVVVTPHDRRQDHHDFYCLKSTKDTWAGIEKRIGDLGSCCSMTYATPRSGA